MGHIPVARPSPSRRPNVSRTAVALALLVAVVGAALALALTFSWPEEGTPARVMNVGAVDDFAPGSVTTFREREFHLVRLPDGEFLALSMLDPHEKTIAEQGLVQSPCLVPWRPDFEFMGRQGWFRNPCHGETYDLAGRCFAGPCPRGLDRFPVAVRDGQVQVDVNELILGPPSDGRATPVSPP
jgi:nitrite reductase/ring-hydroxylating ferredoxin subunit